MTDGSIVRIGGASKYAGQLARVLPYPGRWVHVEFIDMSVRPREKYFPPGSVQAVKGGQA